MVPIREPDGVQLDFNDASWASGAAELGYGDAPVTTVSYGSNASNKYITTYFRKTMTIANPSSYTIFIAGIRRDDGCVVYVNGVQVYISNLTAPVAFNTLAANAADDGATPQTFTIPTSAFVNGNNVIAVEMHQSSVSSTDLTFDMELTAVTNSGNTNASSADLNLPSCASVLWAGLYWGSTLATSSQSAWRASRDTVKFRIPGAAGYTTVVSTQTDLHDSSAANNHTGYTAYANVTSLLNASSPNGTYIIANVTSPVSTGLNNQTAGWCLVVVYSDPTTIPRNLVVFDGFDMIAPGGQKDIPIAGFLTPLSGPVSCEFGAICYDGDRGSSDGFFFKQDSAAGVGTYTDLSNTGTSGNADSWNSTISYFGADVSTRNPDHTNTLGYDADIVRLSNPSNTILGNNKTSARIRISSPSSGGENFFLQVVTSSISVMNPTFNVVKSSTDLSGGALLPGDSLLYTIIYQNNGVDTSIHTVVLDSIPYNATYKAGSLTVNGVAKTDASGDDIAEYDATNNRVVFRVGTGATSLVGGQMIPNANDTVTFKVKVTDVCSILECDHDVSNQAYITYTGKNSGQSLIDYSGTLVGGCFVPGPIVNTVTGNCGTRNDTTVVNVCPATTYTLPAANYTGYLFYRAQPFTPANLYNTATAITSSGTYWAYIQSPSGGCRDTIRFFVIIVNCLDIDDDDDGIPDYVESNGADVFADTDGDGNPDFTDPSYAGFIDTNTDGVNDNFDTDLDGIPNQYDKDSDNDGIPDVVESYGVDANGDGKIDNYTDTDGDGFSQNADANNTGAAGSGNGLGLPDLDGDGIPNALDLDSDNDGIPDIIEAAGTDANNDGKTDSYFDSDADGYNDAIDGDVGNDGTAENAANTLLRTGADSNSDGRADSYPYKNFDSDTRANPYDIDSDNDGITDTREAGFPDIDSNGFTDGVKGTDGWDNTIDAIVTLTLLNSDASGNPNYLDIDADDDGIPDNVEGLSTLGYVLPTGIDTDGDGLDNAYDAVVGFGANGITPNDQDGDLIPDYIDKDTDGDGALDIYEGNDFNLNGLVDDLVALTGVDTDGDGLDDRFDTNNSSIEGTSRYMGTMGTFLGDNTPGSSTMVQMTIPGTERDWRYIPFILNAEFISLTGVRSVDHVNLHWTITCTKVISYFNIERSLDGRYFENIGTLMGTGAACNATPFNYSDDISLLTVPAAYYRITAITVNGQSKRSQLLPVRLKQVSVFTVSPNPANSQITIGITSSLKTMADIFIIDEAGRMMIKQQQLLKEGYNSFNVQGLQRLQPGIYAVRMVVRGEAFNQKIIIQK